MDVWGFPIAMFDYRRVHDQTLEFQMLFPRSPWVAMGFVFSTRIRIGHRLFLWSVRRSYFLQLGERRVSLPETTIFMGATRFRVGSRFRFKTAFHEFPT